MKITWSQVAICFDNLQLNENSHDDDTAENNEQDDIEVKSAVNASAKAKRKKKKKNKEMKNGNDSIKLTVSSNVCEHCLINWLVHACPCIQVSSNMLNYR